MKLDIPHYGRKHVFKLRSLTYLVVYRQTVSNSIWRYTEGFILAIVNLLIVYRKIKNILRETIPSINREIGDRPLHIAQND